MSDVSVPSVPADDLTLEGTPDPVLDVILEYWPRIAVTAWEGAVTCGPGAVTVEVEPGGVAIGYRAGSPCACHPVTGETYDARTQAVVIVCRDGEATIPIVVTGWPTPERAPHMVGAAAMEATVQ